MWFVTPVTAVFLRCRGSFVCVLPPILLPSPFFFWALGKGCGEREYQINSVMKNKLWLIRKLLPSATSSICCYHFYYLGFGSVMYKENIKAAYAFLNLRIQNSVKFWELEQSLIKRASSKDKVLKESRASGRSS